MRVIFFIIALSSFSAAAAPCDGVESTLPTGEKYARLLNFISKEYGKSDAEFTIFRYMGKDGWHLVWGDPKTAEPWVFFLREEKEKLQYVSGWGGDAGGATEEEVMETILKDAPSMPAPLAECLVRFLVSRDEPMANKWLKTTLNLTR
jgi:hypothetical protein